MRRRDSLRHRGAPLRTVGFAAVLLAALALLTTPAHAAGLLVADGGLGGVLEIKEHTVEVTFNNGIVVTEVNQVFVNTESRQVEALSRCRTRRLIPARRSPAPARAALA